MVGRYSVGILFSSSILNTSKAIWSSRLGLAQLTKIQEHFGVISPWILYQKLLFLEVPHVTLKFVCVCIYTYTRVIV